MLTDSLRDQSHDERLDLCTTEIDGATVDAPCDDCDGEGCGECRHTGLKRADVRTCRACGGTGDGPHDWRGSASCEWCKGTGKVLEYRVTVLWEIEVTCRHGGCDTIICYDWDLDHEMSRLDRRSVVVTRLQG